MHRRASYAHGPTGHFTQEDPIGLAGGMNLYGFAGGDPVNFSDPFGLCPPLEPCPVRAGTFMGAALNGIGGQPNIATTGIMQTLEAMILDLAADDYTGLWELVWDAGAKSPEVETATLRKLLLTALENLITNGKVKLYRGTTFAGEENAVPTTEAEELLAREDSWEPPEANAVHLRLLTEE